VTYQIIYSSEAATPMQTDDLQELLDRSRRSNAAKGITGALIYAEGSFLQILEGDKVQRKRSVKTALTINRSFD
jgi:Sensors of blue-light using FAD